MISLWLSKVWGWLVLAGAVVAGLFALRQSGKAAGRRDIENDIRERDAESRKQADAVASKVNQMDDDSLADEFDRLRDKRRR